MTRSERMLCQRTQRSRRKTTESPLQSGKSLGPVNDSAVIYEFHNELDMAMEDIATEMQISQTKVKKSLRTYSMYVDYVRTTGDLNTKRYTLQRGPTESIGLGN